MKIIKNVFYAVCPLHSDLKRDKATGRLTSKKNMGFVWTKRSIALAFTLLSLALITLALLALNGRYLPVGTIGFYSLSGAAVAAVTVNILYLLGLFGGLARSASKVESSDEDREGIPSKAEKDDSCADGLVWGLFGSILFRQQYNK